MVKQIVKLTSSNFHYHIAKHFEKQMSVLVTWCICKINENNMNIASHPIMYSIYSIDRNISINHVVNEKRKVK